ncbi:hypothetical protein SAMN05421780_101350 [Flexibacter flexilis DSM 6793]|uniref:Uncharacterized protein n=1 Tax=Flexibacter flexilis DSM 6793 TaxID=927664 RepID=A0A1I1DNF7_9BACT|nr:hypothetical protein SAMN05421780_101350 [Flexibacter flexilis DSM 6793]
MNATSKILISIGLNIVSIFCWEYSCIAHTQELSSLIISSIGILCFISSTILVYNVCRESSKNIINALLVFLTIALPTHSILKLNKYYPIISSLLFIILIAMTILAYQQIYLFIKRKVTHK